LRLEILEFPLNFLLRISSFLLLFRLAASSHSLLQFLVMLSVLEAQAIVLNHARALRPVRSPVSVELLGQVLAEDIASDLDMPPFDKSLMDGFAVRSGDLPQGKATLSIIEEVTAGQTPARALEAMQATRIMTGAPIPAGADAVVMIERTRLASDGRVEIEDQRPRPGQNIMSRGREMRCGETVLQSGTVLRPQEFGILASVGKTSVAVIPRPTVSALTTGDEVVDASRQPGPGQIRNGNGPMLLAQIARAGGITRSLGIAPDDATMLRSMIKDGLQSNVLVLSGGVSAGKLDLVPGVLQEVGVQAHFHKVALKPGKPILFGTWDTGTLVFGLPGNPVSALVGFELFVRPAIRRLAGHEKAGPFFVEAALAESFTYKTDRPTYYPAALDGDNRRVRPVPWFGSPDLRALTNANSFLVIAAGEHQLPAGRVVSVMRTDE
jgi:molybdopterin molybdotransferase